jgi:hypothetical protein
MIPIFVGAEDLHALLVRSISVGTMIQFLSVTPVALEFVSSTMKPGTTERPVRSTITESLDRKEEMRRQKL